MDLTNVESLTSLPVGCRHARLAAAM